MPRAGTKVREIARHRYFALSALVPGPITSGTVERLERFPFQIERYEVAQPLAVVALLGVADAPASLAGMAVGAGPGSRFHLALTAEKAHFSPPS